MNSYQNSSGSSASSLKWMSLSDWAHLVDEILRTSIDINPPTLSNPRPASLGPPVDLSSLEYVEGYSYNLSCGICHNPYVRPVRLPCQHVFCTSCFLDSRNSQAPQESCPTCRERVLPGQLYSLPKIVEMILDDLIVKCPLSGSGCTKQMSRCLVQDHVDKYCEYVQVTCPYNDCGEKIQRIHLKKQRCLHKLIRCVTCNQSYKEIDSVSHCATHDGERIVICPGCLTTILGSDLRSHESSCPKVAVSCIAAKYGCDYMGKRVSINQHYAICPLAKLAPFLAQQSSRLDQQEIALQTLRRKNAWLEITCERIESFFTSLSLPTQVTTNGEVRGCNVTFTAIASVLLDTYERYHKDSNLATSITDLSRRMETLSDAQLVNQQVLRSHLLHTNKHVHAVEREMARLKRELSIYRQDTRVPESVGVGTLGASERVSSVARASEDVRMVSRLIPDLAMSRREPVRTGAPVRQHILSTHHDHTSFSNTRSLPLPGGGVDPLADRNVTHSH